MNKKIIKVLPKSELTSLDFIIIEAYISDDCNYNCYYCYNDFPRSRLQMNLDYLYFFIKNNICLFSNKKIYLLLVGGEPTYNKQLFDFISKISSYNIEIQIFSNLSQSFEYYEKIMKYSNVVIYGTCHPYQVKNIISFKDKAKKLTMMYSSDRVKIRMMYEDKYIEKSIECFRIVREATSEIECQLVLPNDNYVANYRKDDIEKYDKIINKFDIDNHTSVKYLYSDGTSDVLTDYDISKNDDMMNFKYFICEAGIKSLFININGDIYPCQVMSKLLNFRPLGNIKTKIDNKFHKTVCLANSCQCLPELIKTRIFK